jgi:hypothetical protein
MIDKVISQAILDATAINMVKPKATSTFFFIAQNNPKINGKHRIATDIQRNTFEALSAEYVVEGDENV